MSTDVERLVTEEAEASELGKDAPIGPESTVKRPGHTRSSVFSVRLNPEEIEQLQRFADLAELPVSTLVRSWILERVRPTEGNNDLKAALVSLRRDVERVERLVA